VLVQTKNCDLHFYVDHRKVNDVTRKDYFTLPMTDDIFDTPTGVDLELEEWLLASRPAS